MKKILILLSFSLIFLLACDRYDNEFKVKIDEEFIEFTENFSVISDSLNAGNFTSLINLFSNDYNNSYINADLTKGIDDKDSIEEYFHSFLNLNYTFEVVIDSLLTNDNFKWTFIVKDSTELLIEKRIFQDVLVLENGIYKFFGNQESATKVFIEFFTASWCTNCPKVEVALEELKAKYGNRLLYLEYHILDNIGSDNSDADSWYKVFSSPPVTFINGSGRLDGGYDNSAELIENAMTPFLEDLPQINLTPSEVIVIDNSYSVNITIDQMEEISTENLYLKYALIDEHNTTRKVFHNVVYHKDSIELNNENIMEPIEISFSYENEISGKAKLVVWVQIMNASYDEASLVHNVIELKIK